MDPRNDRDARLLECVVEPRHLGIVARRLLRCRDRAKLIEQLTAAFSYAQAEVEKFTLADLNKRYKVGNQETTGNAILATYVAGINDYFGQAKVYAHTQTVVGTDPMGFHPYDPKTRK